MYLIKNIEWKPVGSHGWLQGYVGQIHMFSCGPNAFASKDDVDATYKLSIHIPVQIKKTEFSSIDMCKQKAFAILEFFIKHILVETSNLSE